MKNALRDVNTLPYIFFSNEGIANDRECEKILPISQ